MEPSREEPAKQIDVFVTPDHNVAIRADDITIVIPAERAHIVGHWLRAAKGQALQRRAGGGR